MILTPEQGRVLGALVEKELTTPQGYPLTDNALLSACNQTTSRDPVVSYDVATLRTAVRDLREQGLVRTVHRPGERSQKHRHELPAALDLAPEQVAVLAVLLLRGPQTAAELRARSERLCAFASIEAVEDVLVELGNREPALATRQERQPGRKESRWVQLLTGETAGSAQRPAQEVAEELLRALIAALRARDAEAALHVFADDAVVLGSGDGERHDGHADLRAFFGRLLALPATLGWEWDELTASTRDGVLWFLLQGQLVLQGEQVERRPYRISAVAVETAGRYRLVHLHGSEPAQD